MDHDGSGASTPLWILPLAGNRTPQAVTEQAFLRTMARFSPDGRWVTYASNESGRFEVYLQNYPAFTGKWQISTASGAQPLWRADGKALFYLGRNGKLMIVPLTLGATAEVGSPVALFDVRVEGGVQMNGIWHQYDVAADGQRFLVNAVVQDAAPASFTVVLNWHSGLAARETR